MEGATSLREGAEVSAVRAAVCESAMAGVEYVPSSARAGMSVRLAIAEVAGLGCRDGLVPVVQRSHDCVE